MTDIFTRKKRSLLMSGVRTTGTEPEKRVRVALRKIGFKFKNNLKGLPGKPDIVITPKKVVIFVHGCFWHCHKSCNKSKLPTTNKSFWSEKITSNVQRDRRIYQALRRSGWKVITVWECETKSNKISQILRGRLYSVLESNSRNKNGES